MVWNNEITFISRIKAINACILLSLTYFFHHVKALKSSADYWIESLPGLSSSLNKGASYNLLYHQYAGYVSAENSVLLFVSIVGSVKDLLTFQPA